MRDELRKEAAADYGLRTEGYTRGAEFAEWPHPREAWVEGWLAGHEAGVDRGLNDALKVLEGDGYIAVLQLLTDDAPTSE